MRLEQFIAKNLQADGFDVSAETIETYTKIYEFICDGAINDEVVKEIRVGLEEEEKYV